MNPAVLGLVRFDREPFANRGVWRPEAIDGGLEREASLERDFERSLEACKKSGTVRLFLVLGVSTPLVAVSTFPKLLTLRSNASTTFLLRLGARLGIFSDSVLFLLSRLEENRGVPAPS